MPEHRIQQHFIDSADLLYHAAQTLSRPIADAIQALLASVTSGGKVLVCGQGPAASEAQRFAALFVGGFERERPGLGAVALASDGAMLSSRGHDPDLAGVYARQVRALGQPGDVLLLLSATAYPPPLLLAIAAAHERDMMVVALCGQGGERLVPVLRETDVSIGLSHEQVARIHEVHLLVLHCLCDGVDTQLLGEQEISV